jgi:hypothetical protein
MNYLFVSSELVQNVPLCIELSLQLWNIEESKLEIRVGFCCLTKLLKRHPATIECGDVARARL